MLHIILIAGISAVCFYAVRCLSRVIHLEKQILFLILGIIAGIVLRQTGHGSLETLLPEVSPYDMTALLFMFFVAGFTINIPQLRRSGKITAQMAVIPVYFETALMAACMYCAAGLFPSVGYKLQFVEALIVAAIFSTSSPANIIPICSSLIKDGYTDRNNIPGTIILASIVDSFMIFPVVFVGLFVILMQQAGAAFTIATMLGIIVGSIAAIAIALVIGIALGWFIVLIASFAFRKLSRDKQAKYRDYLVILLAFALACGVTWLLQQVDILEKSISIFAILIMCGIGASINHFDKTGVSGIIRRDGNNLFTLFGMPMIFLTVGSNIDLRDLLDFRQLIFFVVLAFLAVYVKSLAAKFILRDARYSDGERHFAAMCYIPKGMSLINFTVLFSALLDGGSSFVKFMTMLGAISVIVTMSVGLPLISHSRGRRLQKKDDSDPPMSA